MFVFDDDLYFMGLKIDDCSKLFYKLQSTEISECDDKSKRKGPKEKPI